MGRITTIRSASVHRDCGKGLRTLRAGQLQLWTVGTDDPADAAIACRLQRILSADEQMESRRFRRARDRDQFIIARALVRLALSQYFPIPAGDWRFDRDNYGKPFVASPQIWPPVRFNVSHTEGLIACLVTRSGEAAVDAEKVEYSRDLPLVARRVFSPAELTALSELSGRNWTTRFFDLWTLKEAYAKARGLGLSLMWSDISFELGPDNAISAHFSSALNDDPSVWVFWRCPLSSRHIIAVAVKRDFQNTLEIVQEWVRFDELSMKLTPGHRIVVGPTEWSRDVS
jgi:4'-phosphopantetheinyl transferase